MVGAKVLIAGLSDGSDDGIGVLSAAHLERGVDTGLAHVEVHPLALVLDLDEVGAGRGEHGEQPHEAAGSVVDAGGDDEPASGLGLVATDQTGNDPEVDVATRQHDARRARRRPA